MTAVIVKQPSDAAWKRAAVVAAQILRDLAERDIEREAQQGQQDARDG